MTLKSKQKMYTRFQSKMESACYQCVDSIVSQHNAEVSDRFINDIIVPEVWEYLNKRVPELVQKHTK
jgi:hypothetical protein